MPDEALMKDWNVIITVFQDGYRRAIRALHKLGPAERSPYHNVLLMPVEDPIALLEAIERQTETDPRSMMRSRAWPPPKDRSNSIQAWTFSRGRKRPSWNGCLILPDDRSASGCTDADRDKA